MSDEQDLIKKIQRLRKEYSFDSDKRQTYLWEKAVRESILKSELAETDAIKMFISECQKMIDDINFLLLNDREQTTEVRKLLFQKLDDYEWFISFFSTEDRIKNIETRVNQELT